jgi:hypothetical protein
MNNKPIFNKPKYMGIKLFIFSLTLAMVLWVWGIFSTRDLIKNAVNQMSSLPDPSVVIPNLGIGATQPSTTLRKVQVPSPVPAITNVPATNRPPTTAVNTNRLPLTNTGSSRP